MEQHIFNPLWIFYVGYKHCYFILGLIVLLREKRYIAAFLYFPENNEIITTL